MPASPPAAPAKTTGNAPAGNQPAPRPWPFPVGVYESDVQDYSAALAQTANAQQFPIWNLSPTGWIRGVWLDVNMVVSGNVTNSVSFSKDNPWSAIQSITLYDLGNEVILQLLGYQVMVMNKYGGYFNVGDPRSDVNYSTTTGTGGSGGSFHFTLYLPLEIIARSALGVVQNESKPGWKIQVYLDSQANTYNQVPSVFGTLTILGYIASYTEPAGGSASGRPFSQTPPQPSTLQYWKYEGATVIAAGQSKYDLTNGIGFPIRNVFYVFYDTSANTRAAGQNDIPTPFQLFLGNVQLYNRLLASYLAEAGRDFGFFGSIGGGGTANTFDTSQAPENGVLPFYRTLDFDSTPGSEYGYKYWDTNVNTLFRLQGSFAAQVNLFAMVNWIATPSKNRYALIAGGQGS